MSLSRDLTDKSIQAAVAAIEIYNKPNFSYREEAFALLMTNAWELLLKAKWLFDREDVEASLHQTIKDHHGNLQVKAGRSGNPISHGLPYLAKRLL